MKIIIQKTPIAPEITIDTKDCKHCFSFRDAFELALQQEGFMEEFILEVFNDAKVEPEPGKS